MPRTQEQLRASVPNRHYNLVAIPQGLQRSSTDPGEPKITDLHYSTGVYQDVGWLEISMNNTMSVKVRGAEEELMEK